MLSSLLWTDGTSSGLASVAANWTDIIFGTNAVPGPTDYAYWGGTFGALSGSDTDCIVDGNFVVDRVIMDSTGADAYTATLAIGGANSLHASNFFQQAGTLALTGGVASANINFNVNGALTALAGTSAVSAGELFVTGSAFVAPTVTLLLPSDRVEIDPGAIVTVAPSGTLAFTGGAFLADSDSTITLGTGSMLSFAGTPTALINLEGLVTMTGATINSTDIVRIDGGTLEALGGEMIDGDLAVVNLGTINVGSPVASGSLMMPSGSLTVGALGPSLPATGGTLNVYAGGNLGLPAAPISSTFTIKGDVNMYGGAQIFAAAPRVAVIDIRSAPPGESAGVLNSLALTNQVLADAVTCSGTINVGPGPGSPVTSTLMLTTFSTSVSGQANVYEGSWLATSSLSVSGGLDMYGGLVTAPTGVSLSGTLRTHGGSAGAADSITTALLTNTGTIRYLDLVHVPALSEDYTQTSSGNLEMRLANGQVSDLLTVGDTATLAGTLKLAGMGTLDNNQTWTLINAGTLNGNFAAFVWPDADPDWSDGRVGGSYTVDNA